MIEALVDWLGGGPNTIAFAILSGVIGFLAKGIYDLWLARRNDKLSRVNQQLKLLYGPLYSLNQSGYHSWSAFRSRYRPGKAFFGTEPKPTDTELEAWRLWMTIVFQPIHVQMCDVIEKNADLLIEDDLPEPLQKFLAHVSVYKTVFTRWENNDYSEYTSIMNYPTQELQQYLMQSFRYLKEKQRKLISDGN